MALSHQQGDIMPKGNHFTVIETQQLTHSQTCRHSTIMESYTITRDTEETKLFTTISQYDDKERC